MLDPSPQELIDATKEYLDCLKRITGRYPSWVALPKNYFADSYLSLFISEVKGVKFVDEVPKTYNLTENNKPLNCS